MRKIQVNVTQEDIDRARREREDGALPSQTCPIAQALNREQPRKHSWSVGSAFAQLNYPRSARWSLDHEGREVIEAFDYARLPLSPTVVTLSR